MARIIEKTLFQFAELPADAKERARDRYRGCIDADEISENGDDWSTIAGILGVSFDQHRVALYGGGSRYDDSIYWALDPVECAFDGSYIYAKGAPAAIRRHAPRDVELHRIADELQATQRSSFYGLNATTKCRDAYHMSVDVFDRFDDFANGDTAHRLAELLRDFARWIGKQLEAQRDYLFSDEAVDESIEANGYEFDEEGNIA